MTFDKKMVVGYLTMALVSIAVAIGTTGCCGNDLECRTGVQVSGPMVLGGDADEDEGTDTGDGGEYGGDGTIIQIPLPEGAQAMCVQGAHGDYSHSSDATRYDLDLDTSNWEHEELYAPVSGVAYTHNNASSGFGRHINIDLGDGTFVLIAHLEEIFIEDGVEVAAGQLIGYEGCTGNCTGDHIHLGLHEGSASVDASNSRSIKASYWVANASDRGAPELLGSEDFECGLASAGDAHDGDFYASDLPVTRWHPDGTLIKSPDNARVYVIDEGKLSWIENETAFWSRGWSFDEVVLVADEEIDCYGNGSDLSGESYLGGHVDEDGTIWLVVGTSSDADRYRQRVSSSYSDDVLLSYGIESDMGLPSLDDYRSWPAKTGEAGFREGVLITERSSSAVYQVSHGVAIPVIDWETYLLSGYEPLPILQVDDGAVPSVMREVGSCSAGMYCLDSVAVTSCGGGLDLGEGEYGGSDWEDEESEEQESNEEEEESEEEESSEEGSEEEEEEESSESGSTSTPCGGDDACIADTDGDGVDETLYLVEDQWTTSVIDGYPAFIYGNGGCFDGTLSTSDLVYATDGYYQIDFSGFAHTCSVELTVINSVGTDGNTPASDMSNWYWWQNASFCSGGESLCELMDNGTSWEEWLIKVSWNSSTGLVADGNGYTSNSQL